jgi:hypothetical protein
VLTLTTLAVDVRDATACAVDFVGDFVALFVEGFA